MSCLHRYVIVKGDYAGRVYGNIYDISNTTNSTNPPVPIPTTVSIYLMHWTSVGASPMQPFCCQVKMGEVL